MNKYVLLHEMKENSIIFLDLDDVHLFAVIQHYDSPISHLTSAFRIEWRRIKYQYPLSLYLKIFQ